MKLEKKNADDNPEEELYGIQKERNIRQVQFGLGKKFLTWYGSNVYFNKSTRLLGYINMPKSPGKKGKIQSPVGQYWLDTLYICEYCFKYTDQLKELESHISHCLYAKKAPGRIMYKSPDITIRRVKGWKHELYCQCLCLFTKLFLDNKSMYFKLPHYEFYIIYKTGSTKPMGYFSKDILSYARYNLACILTFPPYQRQHVGTYLMEFSYKLSKLEGIASGPETPLSPFGLISYINYWSRIIAMELLEGELMGYNYVTLEMISKVTGFRISDIITTFKQLDCLDENDNILLNKLKMWAKGKSKHLKGYYLDNEYFLADA
ncbi:hypothetical protein TBLA_0H00310 [Henningerozyma blattae CBS 6284]|uniref:histone acetyltransferase n=1 Tax=Henningerozyma blattae (strain ATCC 34711 / CBS 6284 / DSM 70876 / NBRC 10599 / NRRL Y-10934 / UCD 77-7) TaxID=1071380 RepID=I2H7H2_HENB6|nr:hypothetical protein TBLA_0H00310 [Tetrapisispora blattae CBS 6284]CCH62324.1 hypothetical protein TBLA_0H00310 [Tetrapisispora blattae CBS 6284]